MKKENDVLRVCAWVFLIFGLVLGAALLSAGVVYNGGADEKSKMFASLYFSLGTGAILINVLYSMCLFIIYKKKTKK